MGDDPTFVVTCTECEMDCRTDDLAEAIDFAVNHYRHTGHSPDWDRCPLVDGVVTIPERTRWKVHCETCGTERYFEERDAADEFSHDHETYAGHQPETMEKVTLPEIDEPGADEVETVVNYCLEHAEETETIPAEAVVSAFEEQGVPRRRTARELEIAIKRSSFHRLGEGYLSK